MRPIYQAVEAQNKAVFQEAQSGDGNNSGKIQGSFKDWGLCQIKSNSQKMMECATPNYREEITLESIKVVPTEVNDGYVNQMKIKFMKMEYDAASPSMKLILGYAAQGYAV